MNDQKHLSDIIYRLHRPKVWDAAAIPSNQKQILLVDDDCGIINSLSGVLTEEGFGVFAAANGVEALDIANRFPVDLVILDLNMPVKNGWDTFERFSTEHPLVPVIVATARPNQLFTALGAGVGALMEKPLDIPQLLNTMRRLLAESNITRLRRLVGQETPFDYSPSIKGPQICPKHTIQARQED